MTQEELKLENDKLNARLQKAITVFAEQKANIARLTEERDEALGNVDKLKNRISELEASAAKSNEDDDKFFEQLQEIDALKNELGSVKELLGAEETKATALAENVVELSDKLAEQEQKNTQLTEQYDEIKKTEEKLNASLEKSREVFKENKAKIQELEESLANMTSSRDELSSNLNESVAENEKLKDNIITYTEALKNADTMLEQANNKIAVLENTISENNERIVALGTELTATQASMEQQRKGAQEKMDTFLANISKQVQSISQGLETNVDLFAL